MENNYNWIAYITVWISISLTISFAIYITHEVCCLWFFIIPLFIKINVHDLLDTEITDEDHEMEV